MSFLKWLSLLLCFKLCFAFQDNDSILLKQMEKTVAEILDRLEEKETKIKRLENTVTALEEKVASQGEIIKVLREQKQHIVEDELSETQDNVTFEDKATETTLKDNDSIHLKKIEDTLANSSTKLKQKETRIKLLKNTISALDENVASQDELIKVLREEKQHSNIKDVPSGKEDNSLTGEKLTIKDQKNSSSFKQAKASRVRRAENENHVAFLAALTSHTQHVGANQNIAFDKVITNVGSAYNPHGGLFIAPVPGIYVFSATLLAYPHTATHYNILKNGSLVTRMYYPDTHDTTSMTVVLELETGDDVSVSNVDSDKTIHGDLYCSFSGFLLQKYYQPDSSVIGK